MVEELEQGPRADMITIEVPDYFKRPSQVEDTGQVVCAPVSWRFSKLGKDKVALIDYCTSSSQLCPSQAVHWVWEYLDLANTRFFSPYTTN